MATIFTSEQKYNIHLKYHPDCCSADVCPVCGATEAPGDGGCLGRISGITLDLWRAAVRHDHNADPSYVLHTSTTNDSKLIDLAARQIFSDNFNPDP